jgi:hypothetical protein
MASRVEREASGDSSGFFGRIQERAKSSGLLGKRTLAAFVVVLLLLCGLAAV